MLLIFGDIMQEMNEKLQEQLWADASAFVDKSSRKHLAKLGVTLEGSDNQYMELSFTCPCCDEDFDDFLAIIDNDFLQVVRFEHPNVRIQEFVCDIPIEVDFDRYDWQHILQFSIGGVETEVFNKFQYWKKEHDKMSAGFRKSTKEFDLIYLQSLKKIAKQLGVECDAGGDIYNQMLIIENAIEEKLGGE